MQSHDTQVFRFAPSPNGALHLGHALSAMLNSDLARGSAGKLLLRIEDIDTTRCTPEFEAGIYADLAWLGIEFETPVRRQSDHFADYRATLQELIDSDLVYPAFMTRGEVKAKVAQYEGKGKVWPRDPDGAPLYPDNDRSINPSRQRAMIEAGTRHAWRLDMQKAISRIREPLFWNETGDSRTGIVMADPAVWGDVILSRSDAPSSYHLSVVVDDAIQGVTDIVRGMDLFHATSVHRLLQHLLGLPSPAYHHHHLLMDASGKKLSKSEGSTGLSNLRNTGMTPSDIRRLVGL